MRILHIADLHIGKIVNGYSMLEEQSYALDQVLHMIKEHEVEALIMAGDIYDTRYPSDESVKLFNDFMTQLIPLNLHIFIISGNHDAGTKLAFANKLLAKQNVHIVGDIKDGYNPIVLEDEYGSLNFYLIPFIRPSDVRVQFEHVSSYDGALKAVIAHLSINENERNILVGHQFFSSGSEVTSDSERLLVGGIEQVSYTHLIQFDYVALGHLHRSQIVKEDHIRYSGSLVKYSLSEVNDQKSVILFDIKEKGTLHIQKLALTMKHDFKHVEGMLEEIVALDATDDYMFVTLNDDYAVDAIVQLKVKFKNLMNLDFNNARTKASNQITTISNIEAIPPLTLFNNLYETFHDEPLSESQIKIVNKIMEGID